MPGFQVDLSRPRPSTFRPARRTASSVKKASATPSLEVPTIVIDHPDGRTVSTADDVASPPTPIKKKSKRPRPPRVTSEVYSPTTGGPLAVSSASAPGSLVAPDTAPLPDGWELSHTPEGIPFFIEYVKKISDRGLSMQRTLSC